MKNEDGTQLCMFCLAAGTEALCDDCANMVSLSEDPASLGDYLTDTRILKSLARGVASADIRDNEYWKQKQQRRRRRESS